MTQAYTRRFTEICQLPGHAIDTWAIGVHTVQNYVNLANHQRAVVLLFTGEMAQGATLDLSLLQATDAAGTGAKAIAGKAITQLTQAGGDANDRVCIELRTEELDVDNGFCFVGATMTIAGGTVEACVTGFLIASNYVPVSVAVWTEIVD